MISIIIPTYNRKASLVETLKSLLSLKTKRDLFEIIVVDNGSTDTTFEEVEKIRNANPDVKLNYFLEEIPGLLSGRHRGAKEAQGEILTFIDDDVLVSVTWLDTIIETMDSRPDISLLTGPNIPEYESDPPQWLDMFWTFEENGKHCGWLSLLDFGAEVKEISPLFVWGLNFTIRKNVFIELEGFHPDNIPEELQRFQGDGESGLCLKAIDAGHKALYHPQLKLQHVIPGSRLTEKYFEKRAFYQGVANAFSSLKFEQGIYKESYSEINTKRSKSYVHILKRFVKKRILVHSIGKKIEKPNFKLTLSLVEKKGFDFLREQFLEDEQVKNWVLKENYLNYKLPIS